MEPGARWGCHDVHLSRLPHLHCHIDLVLVDQDFGGDASQSDHVTVLVVGVLNGVTVEEALNDVLTGDRLVSTLDQML